MSRIPVVSAQLEACFPRVSGDEPFGGHGRGADLMFSPRERG